MGNGGGQFIADVVVWAEEVSVYGSFSNHSVRLEKLAVPPVSREAAQAAARLGAGTQGRNW